MENPAGNSIVTAHITASNGLVAAMITQNAEVRSVALNMANGENLAISLSPNANTSAEKTPITDMNTAVFFTLNEKSCISKSGIIVTIIPPAI